MKPLIILPTDKTPKIDFTEHVFQLSGMSIPKDYQLFYNSIYEYLDLYAKSIKPHNCTIVEMGLAYTCKEGMYYIEKLLQKFVKMHCEDHEVMIAWFFCDTSISVKVGENLSNKLNFPFIYIDIHDYFWLDD